QEVTRLVYDAAVGIAMPRMRKAPKKGERVKTTITNNTLLDIAAFEVSTRTGGTSYFWDYSGDALPPGRSEVTLEADPVHLEVGIPAVPGRTARVRYVRFAEAAKKK
ncbi:MAG: hypothetical protein ACYS9X_19505, partial [Planctomycetota bacterium]